MQIIRKILVKQVVTELSKQDIKERFQKKIEQLDKECQQLAFERKKMEYKAGINKYKVNERFQQEITKREEKHKQISYQLDQLELIPVGEEIIEGEVERLVNVEVGTNWNNMIQEQAIVVQDGVIIRIE
ncbi:hypothetical protein GCM10011351_03850 [Paraliobacillus quinghaiensis]|uniref:YlqD protein n=1 Tax=Paraliobacillus quinghaiensis TaxID=470815 RepID=A0A917WQF8_9BACI|nr:YlqD family protein [Paraliobacillus quinghaiensis]GGM21238.1 hypothetical protein GCM10011351_03850 [Paraliobacillus quinghaiensis]